MFQNEDVSYNSYMTKDPLASAWSFLAIIWCSLRATPLFSNDNWHQEIAGPKSASFHLLPIDFEENSSWPIRRGWFRSLYSFGGTWSCSILPCFFCVAVLIPLACWCLKQSIEVQMSFDQCYLLGHGNCDSNDWCSLCFTPVIHAEWTSGQWDPGLYLRTHQDILPSA